MLSDLRWIVWNGFWMACVTICVFHWIFANFGELIRCSIPLPF